VRELFPSRAVGWTAGAAALIQATRIDEADDLLTGAMARFPMDPHVAYAWADLPLRRGVEIGRVERWRSLRTGPLEHPAAYAAGALLLWDTGHTEEAEIVSREGLSKFPRDRDMNRAYGIIRFRIGEFEAADRALELALKMAPNDQASLHYYIQSAISAKNHSAAQARLDLAKPGLQDEKQIEHFARSIRRLEDAAGEEPPDSVEWLLTPQTSMADASPDTNDPSDVAVQSMSNHRTIERPSITTQIMRLFKGVGRRGS
jgi:tetratricopeptide (TPR) repeat protein